MSFVDRFVQDLLELVNHHATYRFIINGKLLIRVINWNSRVYDSATCKGLEFREAIKVLYQHQDTDMIKEWTCDNQVDKLVYMEQELIELVVHLKKSTLGLAPTYKTMDGFQVGFLQY